MQPVALQSDLRLATPADLYAVQGIVRCAYSPYVSRIGRKPGPMLDDYVALMTADRVHVIERYGAVEGLIVLIPEHDAMLLEHDLIDVSRLGFPDAGRV